MVKRPSALAVAAAASLVALPAAAAMPVPDTAPPGLVKILRFPYRAHNGDDRLAFLVSRAGTARATTRRSRSSSRRTGAASTPRRTSCSGGTSRRGAASR